MTRWEVHVQHFINCDVFFTLFLSHTQQCEVDFHAHNNNTYEYSLRTYEKATLSAFVVLNKILLDCLQTAISPHPRTLTTSSETLWWLISITKVLTWMQQFNICGGYENTSWKLVERYCFLVLSKMNFWHLKAELV